MNLFSDLKSPSSILAKGFLFLALAIIASCLLLYYARSWSVAALLGIAIWASCRFYYFAFYVIEHYVDGTYRFSGLLSFARYLLKSRHHSDSSNENL